MKDRLILFILKIQIQCPEAEALLQVLGSGLFCVLGFELEDKISVCCTKTVTGLFSFLQALQNHHEKGGSFDGKETIVIDEVPGNV